MSIFDWLTGSASGAPSGAAPSQAAPQTQPAASGPQPILGGLLSYDPNGGLAGMTPAQKMGMFGASLSDVAAALRGQPGGNAANFQMGILQRGMMQRQMQARQQIAQAMQSGDPSAMKKALAGGVAAGLDISPYQSKPIVVRNNGSVVTYSPLTQSFSASPGQPGAPAPVVPANAPQAGGPMMFNYNSDGSLQQ